MTPEEETVFWQYVEARRAAHSWTKFFLMVGIVAVILFAFIVAVIHIIHAH